MYEQLPCSVLRLNEAGVIVYANPFFCQLLQREREGIIERHIEQLLSIANKFIFHSYFYPQLHIHGIVEEFVLHFERHDGTQIPLMINAHWVKLETNVQVECVLMSMTKRIEYEQEIRTMAKKLEQVNEEQAHALAQLQQLHAEIEEKQQELIMITNTDKLTNIFNRRYIEHYLAQLVEEAGQTEDAFSLCILDIDFFKKVNDTYGHQVGDYVLIEIASLMKQHIGEEGIVARYGGEEFILLLPNMAKEQAVVVSNTVNEAVRTHTFEHVPRVTISIGVSTYRAGDTESMMINRADRALYYAKQHGRDCTIHFRDIEHVLHP
ncbi:MAG: sensor domain-containing diguanylate cyclase [Caryophanon sp.]|nr:sensor domain-containing diguanylate cyclase [Caryophanon sp.]